MNSRRHNTFRAALLALAAFFCSTAYSQVVVSGVALVPGTVSPGGGGGSGTVTSVSFTGGLISVASPTTTPAFTVAGTSGGVPYFNSTSTWASSLLLTSTAIMTGGGAGGAPQTPSATSTLDSSGNMVLASSLTLNGSTAGAVSFGQGSLPSLATTSVTFTAPVAVTSYSRTLSGTVGATGLILETVSGTNQTESLTSTSFLYEPHGATWDGGGSVLTTGKAKGYFVCPFAATISGFNISVDTGTATFTVWKVATGTAVPTVANLINTSGVAISSGTNLSSTTTSDFTTTAVAAGDILAFNLTAVSGATQATFTLRLTKI